MPRQNDTKTRYASPEEWPEDYLATEKELEAEGLNAYNLQRQRFFGDPDGIPYIKLGAGKRSRVRYIWSDVRAWLASRRVDPRRFQ